MKITHEERRDKLVGMTFDLVVDYYVDSATEEIMDSVALSFRLLNESKKIASCIHFYEITNDILISDVGVYELIEEVINLLEYNIKSFSSAITFVIVGMVRIGIDPKLKVITNTWN